jgi:hypothetical protein
MIAIAKDLTLRLHHGSELKYSTFCKCYLAILEKIVVTKKVSANRSHESAPAETPAACVINQH